MSVEEIEAMLLEQPEIISAINQKSPGAFQKLVELAFDLITDILRKWQRTGESGRDGIQNMHGPFIPFQNEIHFQFLLSNV